MLVQEIDAKVVTSIDGALSVILALPFM